MKCFTADTPPGKPTLFSQPTPEACKAVIAELGKSSPLSPAWEPLRAAGFEAPAAAAARQVAPLLSSWQKLTVPFDHPNPEGGEIYHNTLFGWVKLPYPEQPGEVTVTADQALPDQWAVDRLYHHAWYVLELELADIDGIWLRADAIAHACVLFVNGKAVCEHIGGYTPFEVDLSDSLEPGQNTLAIWVQDDTAVMDRPNNLAISQLDFGSGIHMAHLAGVRGGIYLERRPSCHIDRVRIRPSTQEETLRVETWLQGEADGTVEQAVYEWPAGSEPVLTLPKQQVSEALDITVRWGEARQWSTEEPHLYVLRTTLTTEAGNETVETRFGFREFWIEGRQFMLNGVPIRLLGDGSHRHDLLSLVPDRARGFNRQSLEFLKREFHFNSIRLHGALYPQWALEAADEAGFLVINQSGIRAGRHTWYFNAGQAFLDNIEREFSAWYWRDVNSPSCVIWDVENEIIRDTRTPEMEEFGRELERFILQHDPEAIMERSAAGWYDPDQAIIHIHMQEQYSQIIQTWLKQETIPLMLGEFWMGGRGETRLPNSLEYHTREDWHREESRLYREQMLEMRYHGVSGIMSHRLTHWPTVRPQPLLTQDQEAGEYRQRFPFALREGQRALTPVIGFTWPRHGSAIAGRVFEREVVVCNDRETPVALAVRCSYGVEYEQWHVELEPAEQRRLTVRFGALGGLTELTVEVLEKGELLESDCLVIDGLPAEALELPTLRRRLVVVGPIASEAADALAELGLTYEQQDELPEDAAGTLVLVPPDAPDDVLGYTPTATQAYLAAGGRLLSLALTGPPRWLPVGLSFYTAVRSSVPEFNRGGWEPTNKDLIYNRELQSYAAHPALAELRWVDLKEWDPVDGRLGDDALIRPNALGKPADGAYRVLLGGTRRENATLVEAKVGKGTAMHCQLQALRLRHHPAARLLLANLLRYLDGPAWETTCPQVGLLGELDPQRLARLTNLPPATFEPAAEQALILAGDGAEVTELTALAEAGRTVLVLSRETCSRLPGFAVEQTEPPYSGTRSQVVDQPLFWGIASASFLPLEQTPAVGALSEFPAGSEIVLAGHGGGHSPYGNSWVQDIGFYGLETREPTPPIAVQQRLGKGLLIATTLEPWDHHAETHRQLLTTLLTNAGVPAPDPVGAPLQIDVKATVPLQFDGKLDDWTKDLEDISITQFVHATPIPLTCQDVVAGEVSSDLDFSGLVYLLHDADHLYVGGIVYGQAAEPVVELELAEQTLRFEVAAQRLSGHEGIPFVSGSQAASEIVDSRLLRLYTIHRQTGKAQLQPETPGQTFEAAVPWQLLKLDGPPERLVAIARLKRETGDTLQCPPDPDHLKLEFSQA